MILYSLPWLNSRKRIILAYLIEVTAFIFVYFITYKIRFDQFPSFSIYQIFLLHFWILISYVLGRYSNEIHKRKNYLIYFIKTFVVLLSTTSFFLSIMWLFGVQDLSFLFRSFLFPLLYFYSILSFFIQIFISYFAEVKTNTKNKFIFFGSEKISKQIESEIKISNIDLEIKNSRSFEELLKKNFKQCHGILFEDEKLINKYATKIGDRLYSNDFLILNLFRWCEIYLQRFPTKLISFSNVIFYDFKVKKTSINLRIKRVSDVLISLILIFLTCPFVLIACLIIKIEDNGPILYKQIRNGYKGKEFNIYKLRTMKVDSEKNGPQWSKRFDARVTNIGKFLRISRLDELPQLLNVLSGEMSLIGPRPERPEFDIKLKEEIIFYNQRYEVKPGLSGWAQVNYPYGASIEDSANKLSYDLFYIKNISIWLDLLIFFKTIKLILNAKGSKPNQN